MFVKNVNILRLMTELIMNKGGRGLCSFGTVSQVSKLFRMPRELFYDWPDQDRFIDEVKLEGSQVERILISCTIEIEVGESKGFN